MKTQEIVRETFKSAWAQKIFTLTTASIVAIVSLVVLLTAGQGAALENQVISQMNSIGSKLISVADQGQQPGINPQAVANLETINHVAWVLGLSEVTDYNNSQNQIQETGTAGRVYYDQLPKEFEIIKGRAPNPGEAVISEKAAASLGLEKGYGSIAKNTLINHGALIENDARIIDVVGIYQPPKGIKTFQEIILIRGNNPQTDTLRYIYVMAKETAQVTALGEAIANSVYADPESQIVVEPPSGIIELSHVISGQVGESGRKTMLIVLGVGVVIIAVIQMTMVSAKRKDYGRRRALGASRSLIVCQVLSQTGVAALPGAVIGATGGYLYLQITQGQTPSLNFTIGVAVLAVVVAVLAAIYPAVISALRDPVRILRVP